MPEAAPIYIAPDAFCDLAPEDRLLLSGPGTSSPPGACLRSSAALGPIAVGSYLGQEMGKPLFQVESALWMPGRGPSCQRAFVLRALSPMELPREPVAYWIWKEGYSLARISLSDSGARGNREDRSGPRIAEIVRSELPLCLELAFILPDDLRGCKSLLCHLALELQADLILTTGGTGVTSRDLAPEATSAVLERRLPGFEQAMLSASLAKTPHAVISRAKAGILGSSLILNLPGSRKAVEENLAAVLPAFKHTLDKIRDDPSACGRS